jgi:hypothetical protein
MCNLLYRYPSCEALCHAKRLVIVAADGRFWRGTDNSLEDTTIMIPAFTTQCVVYLIAIVWVPNITDAAQKTGI